MADTSVSSGSNPVNSLARDQDRQLEDLKSQHEKKMALLRAQNEKEESDLRSTGEASVNHIRRSTDSRIEGAQKEADSKVQREDEATLKNYSSLKKRAAQTQESVEKEIASSRERADQQVEANHHREDQSFKQSQEQLKEFVSKQRELRAQSEKTSAEQLREAERRGNQTLRKANEVNNRELRDVETDHQIKVQEVTGQNKAVYEETKAQAELRLSQLRRDEDAKLNREREVDNAQFNGLHQKAHDEVVREQQIGQARLKSVIQEDQKKIEAARSHAVTLNEKTQAHYSGEAKRIETEGKHDLSDRTAKFNHLKLEQKQEQKEELNELKTEHAGEEQRARTEHESHLKETVSKLSETLNKQTDSFKKRYEVEAKTDRETLHNQKQLFLREQHRQKETADKISDLELSRDYDQFYKPNSFDANLRENPDHYVLTAKVPGYEKDNVDVRIKDNRIILSSQRSFKDEFKGDGSKTETSSHQSYRQEFELAKPADAKHVVTSIKDDGTITSIIPKKGFNPKI